MSNQVIANIKNVSAQMERVLEPVVLEAAEIIYKPAAADAPGDGSGVIMGTIERVPGRARVGVGADTDHFYYQFAETGRGAYMIRAVDADALLIPNHGDEFFESAQIPAIPAQPFLRPAFDENIQKVKQAIGEGIWKAIKAGVR